MTISYRCYRFPSEVIQHSVWLYLRFTLSFRDVEDLLAERGIIVSYETIRRWVDHFGPLIAADLRRRRWRPHSTWHLDEMVVSTGGRRMYLWRAVDAEGEILDVLVQARRDTRAARRLMLKLLKRQGTAPSVVVTDRLSSYGAAFRAPRTPETDFHRSGQSPAWHRHRQEGMVVRGIRLRRRARCPRRSYASPR